MRAPALAWRESGLRWLWLAGLVLALDQASKAWVLASLRLHEHVPVLPFFDITLMYNTGAAFSFLSDASGWQRWLFVALGLAVSVALVLWLRRLRSGDAWIPAALALVLGGALGNVWDRLQYGHVIDFIYLYYGDWYWPAFNVADSAITVGAILLIADGLLASKRRRV